MLCWFQVHSTATHLHIHVSTRFQFLSPIIFPFTLLHNIEQSSLYYIVGPCWLSMLHIAVCTCPSKLPNYLTCVFCLFFFFLKKLPTCSPDWLHYLMFLSAMDDPVFLNPHQHLVGSQFFILANSWRCAVTPHCSFNQPFPDG